jgi:hypothetical protein
MLALVESYVRGAARERGLAVVAYKNVTAVTSFGAIGFVGTPISAAHSAPSEK